MLQRILAQENVDDRQRALLQASGITTYRHLLQRPLWDLAHIADLSVCETEELLAKLSIRLAPASRSALELFLERANHPMFLRTGLPGIDRALNGGLHCRALSEFVGTAGIGKSQVAMTLAVVCALDYPKHGVIFFDVEHNFSARRLLQIIITRLRQTYAGQDTDIDELVVAVAQRIRVVRVSSIAMFAAKFKEVENAMYALKTKLLIIDCVTTLFLKVEDLTYAQRQHQMLRLARDLKLFADTYEVFIVVTNRATTVEGDDGLLYTKPQLGESWAHCVTTRFVMERRSLCRAITIVKSSVAGDVVQPFTVKEGGIKAILNASDAAVLDDFTIHDEVLSDMALTDLLLVNPVCTLPPTQQKNAESPDTTPHVEQSNEELESPQSCQSEKKQAAKFNSFDIVSDSNSDEEDYESIGWNNVTEE